MTLSLFWVMQALTQSLPSHNVSRRKSWILARIPHPVLPQTLNALFSTEDRRKGKLFFRLHPTNHTLCAIHKMLKIAVLWANCLLRFDPVTGLVLLSPSLRVHEMKRCRFAVCRHSRGIHQPPACRALLWNNLQLFPTWVSGQNTSSLILHHQTTTPIWRRDVGARLKEPFLYL